MVSMSKIPKWTWAPRDPTSGTTYTVTSSPDGDYLLVSCFLLILVACFIVVSNGSAFLESFCRKVAWGSFFRSTLSDVFLRWPYSLRD